jgi:hypothetical protein
MKKRIMLAVICGWAALSVGVVGSRHVAAQKQKGGKGDDDSSESQIKRGFEIAPVPLNLAGKNRALVGLGSYIVNAQGACNDCHTWPNYRAGGDPYLGQPAQINTEHYLAGGRPFGPGLVSANITPDPSTGLPANFTFDQFLQLMRTGHDPDEPGRILQVMPWPVYGNMTEHDLRAVYEYLSAIPHAEPSH